MSPSEQNDIARKRILNVLGTRLYCCEKQLESKICESGPGDTRVFPHVLGDALAVLVDGGPLIAEQRNSTTFYYRADKFDPNLDAHVRHRERILQLHQAYRDLAGSKQFCGNALEAVANTAMLRAGSLIAQPVAQNAEFDFEAVLPDSGILVVGELKNYRQWIYPADKEVWNFLRKAAQRASDEDRLVLPIFITRKAFVSSFELFKSVGGLIWRSHNQFFTTNVAAQLADVKSVDGLGFHDIRFVAGDPPATLTTFFGKHVREQAHRAATRFAERASDVEAVADALARNPMSSTARSMTVRDLMRYFATRPSWDLD